MTENEKILKELRKREFDKILENKEFLEQVISFALKIDKKYIKDKIKTPKEKIYKGDDLITKITDTRIKITIPEYNNILDKIKTKDNLYIAWYDKKSREYKIKIYLDKIFEYCYERVQKDDEEKIKQVFENFEFTKNELINISILKVIIMNSDKYKISIQATI